MNKQKLLALVAGLMSTACVLSACIPPPAANPSASLPAAAQPTQTPTETAMSQTTPTDSPDVDIQPANIESVEIQLLGTAPGQAKAIVRGFLGDGCTSLHKIEQKREKNVITLTVTTQRPKGRMCTQIAKQFEEIVTLDTAGLIKGMYNLNTNGNAQTFELKVDSK